MTDEKCQSGLGIKAKAKQRMLRDVERRLIDKNVTRMILAQFGSKNSPEAMQFKSKPVHQYTIALNSLIPPHINKSISDGRLQFLRMAPEMMRATRRMMMR